jgi:hypothetical protein
MFMTAPCGGWLLAISCWLESFAPVRICRDLLLSRDRKEAVAPQSQQPKAKSQQLSNHFQLRGVDVHSCSLKAAVSY